MYSCVLHTRSKLLFHKEVIVQSTSWVFSRRCLLSVRPSMLEKPRGKFWFLLSPGCCNQNDSDGFSQCYFLGGSSVSMRPKIVSMDLRTFHHLALVSLPGRCLINLENYTPASHPPFALWSLTLWLCSNSFFLEHSWNLSNSFSNWHSNNFARPKPHTT